MSKEKKKTGQNKKIVPIGAEPEDMKILEDPEMDHFLRESVIQEADRIEERLNSDPTLVGVGASDDLFDLIVQKLKDQGIWEEEQPEDKVSEGEVPEEEVSEEKASEGESVGEKEIEEKVSESEELGTEASERPGNDASGGQKIKSESESDSEHAVKGELEVRSETGSQHLAEDRKRKSVEISEEIAVGGGKPEDLQWILSAEDWDSLTLGRQTKKKREQRRRRRMLVLKRTGVVAAMLVLVCGVSLTSEANRRLVLKTWDAVKEGFGFKVATDYVDDENRIYSELVGEEKEAVYDIKEKLGIPVIGLMYKPEEMDYLECDILEDVSQATMIYTYKDTVFFVDMMSIKLETSHYYTMDNDMVLVEEVAIKDSNSAKIWEANFDQEQKNYIVEIETEEGRYILNGRIPLEEIKKMVNLIVFW